MRKSENDEPKAIQAPEVTMRIPGTWNRPEEFYEGLPRGCRCTENGLVLADGAEFELNVLPADEQFPEIFAGSCPKLPTEDERERVENYKVNICVTGRGGSIAAAKQLMAAAAAVMTAGGAGVFIDNSGIAHGASDWRALFDSADDGGVYWAFVMAVRSEEEVYSMGMHVLGLRDAVIPSTGNAEFDSRTLHSFLGYTAFSGAQLKDGELVGDVVLPTFRVYSQTDDRAPETAPMFNPYGRWRLERIDIERN
ncbi:MAG: hypothetical protein L0228_07345 [Planctomycetes bacterium]|nr:hypothetical protein [Planctomycetota bacterium]